MKLEQNKWSKKGKYTTFTNYLFRGFWGRFAIKMDREFKEYIAKRNEQRRLNSNRTT